MQASGKLKMIPLPIAPAMKKAADPVMADYAKEIGAEAIYARSIRCNPGGKGPARDPILRRIVLRPRGQIGGEERCANSSTATTGCSVLLLVPAWPP